MSILRGLLPVLITFLCLESVTAQQPAVPGEEELRERVREFYQLQLDKKFRQAEGLVAEDTKDFYYNSAKGNFRAFRLAGVEIIKPGQLAKATVRATVTITMMGGEGVMPIEMPFSTDWKVENGKWVMFVDLKTPVKTPFGDFRRDVPVSGAEPGGFPKLPNIGQLAKLVDVDKTSVELTADNPVQTVILSNKLPGPVDLSIDSGNIPVADVSISATHIPGGGTATIKIGRKDARAFAGVLKIDAAPLNIVVGIQVVSQ